MKHIKDYIDEYDTRSVRRNVSFLCHTVQRWKNCWILYWELSSRVYNNKPNKQTKNHPHKKNPWKPKEHRLPHQNNYQKQWQQKTKNKKDPTKNKQQNQLKNHRKCNPKQKEKPQTNPQPPKQNQGSIYNTGTPPWRIFMIWTWSLTSLTVTSRGSMLSIFYRGEQAHALSLWQILKRKYWICFVCFWSIYLRKIYFLQLTYCIISILSSHFSLPPFAGLVGLAFHLVYLLVVVFTPSGYVLPFLTIRIFT